MTAGWVDDLDVGDAGVPWSLTVAGAVLAGRHRTLEDVEVAALVGVSRLTVRAWAHAGAVPAVQVDGMWLFDLLDVLAYDEERRRGRDDVRVPAAPLLRQIDMAGGDHALGARVGTAAKKALERARECGTITLSAGDRLAVQMLGLTAWDLWPEWLDAA